MCFFTTRKFFVPSKCTLRSDFHWTCDLLNSREIRWPQFWVLQIGCFGQNLRAGFWNQTVSSFEVFFSTFGLYFDRAGIIHEKVNKKWRLMTTLPWENVFQTKQRNIFSPTDVIWMCFFHKSWIPIMPSKWVVLTFAHYILDTLKCAFSSMTAFLCPLDASSWPCRFLTFVSGDLLDRARVKKVFLSFNLHHQPWL